MTFMDKLSKDIYDAVTFKLAAATNSAAARGTGTPAIPMPKSPTAKPIKPVDVKQKPAAPLTPGQTVAAPQTFAKNNPIQITNVAGTPATTGVNSNGTLSNAIIPSAWDNR